MANVGLDIDGVIYNFVKALRDHISYTTGRPLHEMPDAQTWNFFKDQWGLTTAEYLRYVTGGIEHWGLLKTGDMITGAKQAIDYMRDVRKDRITLVTARDYKGIELIAKQSTLYWLKKNKIKFDNLILTHDKVGFNFDVMFDDAPHNVEALIAAGENGVIFDQAWNRHLTDVPRVIGWAGVLEYLEENFPNQVAKSITAQ